MSPLLFRPAERVSGRFSRWFVAGVAVAAVLLQMQVASVPASAAQQQTAATTATGTQVPMADLSQFRAGNIISDAVFFAKDTMTETEIQSFLNAKVPNCRSGYTCLKDWTDVSRSVPGDPMCAAYSGGVRERAARIIYKVAQACGINPQVLLVMLQKEQGLVSHVWPSDWRYRIAMGQGCPDTAACDSRYYGFFNQVYGAARQMKRYANPPGTSNFFNWYAPGRTWNILYHPNASCGRGPVHVANQATANLYYYTPYQPNAAALRAGYGEGDGCSAYGNRNFFNYFTDWFGSTQALTFGSTPAPTITGTAVAGNIVTAQVAAWSPAASLRYQWLRNGSPIAGATGAQFGLSMADVNTQISVSVVGVRSGYIATSATSSAISVQGYSVDRLAGADRFSTAVEVSKTLYPTGAQTVYLVNGASFADAMAVAPRAARENAALLLVTTSSVPSATANEIARLKPTRIVLVGGAAAIDASMPTRLGSVSSATITRIEGKDRYETSLNVAAGIPASTVYVATGRSFPDALGAAAAAGKSGAPIVLVDGSLNSLSAETAAAFRSWGTSKVVLVGGTSVMSPGIQNAIAGLGITTTRYGGADRYATNAILNANEFGAVSSVVVATAWNFPDALTGSVLGIKRSGPVALSAFGCVPASLTSTLNQAVGGHVTLVGGLSALGAGVAELRPC